MQPFHFYSYLQNCIMTSSILFPTNQFAASCKVPCEIAKSFQEIQKLMIPAESYLKTEQTIQFIMSKGSSQQYPFVYRHFHLCQVLSPPLEFVIEHCVNETPANQVIIAQSLATILLNYHISDDQLDRLLENLLECVHNLNSTANDSLLEVIGLLIKLYPQKVTRKLEGAILEFGKISQPIISKVTAGRIISVLTRSYGRIKGEMIDILKRILSDSEVEARKVWVSQIFPRLLCNLQLDFIELHLQQKFYEAIYDENQEIGASALEVIFNNSTKFSIEEQSSRIVKLFIDSLTSKNEKVAVMTTQIMGNIFEKLQNIIHRSQKNCIKFWESVVEVSQSRNEEVLNNLIYNLPGILKLSSAHYRVEPICEIYIELFYDELANKQLLASYMHEIAEMFPRKSAHLKDVVYWIFAETFEESNPTLQTLKIIDALLINLQHMKQVFFQKKIGFFINENHVQPQNLSLTQHPSTRRTSQNHSSMFQAKDLHPLSSQESTIYFQVHFCTCLLKYWSLLMTLKNGPALRSLYQALSDCHEYIPFEFTEQVLLPKLYQGVRQKTAYPEFAIKVIVRLISRDVSCSNLINNYVSKVNVELSKSTKSYEREASLLFLYECSYHFSIETFQDFKLGEKYLQLSTDNSLRIKLHFLGKLSRVLYFLTKEERIECITIISHFHQDTDPEIVEVMKSLEFIEKEAEKQTILRESRLLKEKQKKMITVRKANMFARRDSKELQHKDILKKKIDTKSRSKMLMKEMPKKKLLPVRNNSSALPRTPA